MHSRCIDAAAGDFHHLDYIEVQRQLFSLRLWLPSQSQTALVGTSGNRNVSRKKEKKVEAQFLMALYHSFLLLKQVNLFTIIKASKLVYYY